MGYSKHSIKLWLDLDGTTIDVVSTQFGYALNSIPVAQVILAAGVNTTTLAASAANFLAGNTAELVPCKLWMESNQEFSDDPTAIKLNGRRMLFEGYMVFVGSEIRRDGLGIDAALIHWLSDLNHGSCVSASSHPENPAQFAFNAGIEDFGGAGAIHFLMTTVAQRNFTAASIAADLWGNGIKPWFEDLAKTDRINAPIFGRNDDPDKSVQKALSRFNGDKLPLDLTDLDAGEVAEAIYQDISASTLIPNNNYFAAMANVTMWDKLVGDLAPTFMFSLVPGPDWAKIVPFIGGLRTPWISGLTGRDVTLRARDATAARLQSQLIRPIGGFGLYGSFGSAAGGFAPGAPIPLEYTIGGTFIASKKGMIIIKRVPRWADLVMFPGGIPVGVGVENKVVAAAQDPAIGQAPAKNPVARIKQAKGLCDRLAHAFYVDEVLKNRTATFISVPRFDVCPGSTISIQAANTDKKEAAYFASVIKVQYEISADPPNIRTIFSLAHIRTAKENKDDRTSIDRHPLYNRVWKGDHLIDPAGGGGGGGAGGAGGAGGGGGGGGGGGDAAAAGGGSTSGTVT